MANSVEITFTSPLLRRDAEPGTIFVYKDDLREGSFYSSFIVPNTIMTHFQLDRVDVDIILGGDNSGKTITSRPDEVILVCDAITATPKKLIQHHLEPTGE